MDKLELLINENDFIKYIVQDSRDSFLAFWSDEELREFGFKERQ